MNTDILTTPSPELKKHVQDLRRDASNVSQDVKNQAAAGLQEIKSEANTRFQEAKGSANEFVDSFRNFAAQHPFKAFGAGVLTGILVTAWCRR
jgi:ElaB/YqjD/DUF883 family membrane-anchored ribosome-binding protein